jgi:hypothetical protein
MIRHAFWLSMATLLAGCGPPPAYQQTIQGVITDRGAVVSSLGVRFISSETLGACGSPYVEGTTDASGAFRFTVPYQPSSNERFAVLIHPFRLCVLSAEGWHSIWNLTTGPAPKHIEFKCDLGTTNRAQKCLVSWEDQQFR